MNCWGGRPITFILYLNNNFLFLVELGEMILIK
jgi:hypothetical protein